MNPDQEIRSRAMELAISFSAMMQKFAETPKTPGDAAKSFPAIITIAKRIDGYIRTGEASPPEPLP
jgi:hypothetical protein